MGHPGITRMKAIARSYFWWNGLDKDIEKLANLCESCQAMKSSPAVAPLHSWVWPDAPWKRLHVDFAGPFLGRTFLIVVDAHSKWPKVIIYHVQHYLAKHHRSDAFPLFPIWVA